MEYDDSNRAFVQAFLARGILTLDEARPILAHIWSVQQKQEVSAADITQDDFSSMISAANDALSPLDYVIRSIRGQEDNERYYALVNTTSDPLTQIATTHSTDEIGYVKRLLDEMFDNNNTERREALCIAGKDALNLAKTGRRETQNRNAEIQSNKFELTAHGAENLLSQLVSEGWLERSQKGFYSLSPRALVELRHWLEETYNDEDSEYKKIKTCEACKEILTVVSVPYICKGDTNCQRGNDVHKTNVLSDYTMSALRPSSEHKVVLGTVQGVELPGMVGIL